MDPTTVDPAGYWIALAMAAAAAVAGLVGAVVFFRRLRIIQDTPTAKIRSAHQGYVELEGRQELMDGMPIVSPLTGTRCTWYRYKVEQRQTHYVNGKRRTRWRKIRGTTSDELFLLVDDTGQCIIDPEGAAVTPGGRDVWYGNSPQPPGPAPGGRSWLASGSYRYTEERMHPADNLYAIGLLRTVGGAGDPGDAREDLRALLGAWKKDAAKMRRFDTDGDGHVDAGEWEAARRAAREEVVRSHAERAAAPGSTLMTRPQDRRRPYILSAVPQEGLARRYAWYAAGLLALGVAASGTALWFAKHHAPMA